MNKIGELQLPMGLTVQYCDCVNICVSYLREILGQLLLILSSLAKNLKLELLHQTRQLKVEKDHGQEN